MVTTLSTIDLNRVKNGSTLLYTACYNGDLEVVKILLQSGADPNIKSNGATNLYIVSWRNYASIIDELIKYDAKINEPNDNTDGAPPLLYAVMQNNIDCVKSLLKHGANLTYMPMYIPYYRSELNNNIESMRVCLYYAIMRNQIDIIIKIIEKDNKIINMIYNNNTPLHDACYIGNVDIVTELIKRGANVNSLTLNNNTPLDITVSGGYYLIFDILIKKNAIFDYERLDNLLTSVVNDPTIYSRNPYGYNQTMNRFSKKKLNPNASSWVPGSTEITVPNY